MLTIAGNPELSTPDGRRLGEAFDSLDFMAAIDIYVNETTRHADVILPPTTALERDHYDIVFHGLAVRNTARWTPAALPKPEGAKHDWEIYRELGLRVQRRLVQRPGLRTRLKQRARLAPSPRQIVAGLLRINGTTTLKQLLRHPEGVDLGPLRPTMPERLQTKNHRIDLAPDLVVGDLPRLHAWVDERVEGGSRRTRAHRSPAQAGQQRLVPQHRAGQPGPPAPPAAHASRGPRRSRHRRRRPGHGDLAGRGRDGRRAGDRRHDARRGVAPPRLRPPGRRRAADPGEQGARRLHQRPDRPRAARPVRATPR